MTLSVRQFSLRLTIGSMLSFSLHAATPMWVMKPTSDTNTHQTVAKNVSVPIKYNVYNQSSKPKNLVLSPIAGIKQLNSCNLAPKGQKGDSCVVSFQIEGAKLLPIGLMGGPTLCQAGSNGNQCYQPAPADQLKIKSAPALENWDNWGQNARNNHFNKNSGIYGKQDVQKIAELCRIDYTDGLVSPNSGKYSNSSKPVIIGDMIYWTGFAGKIGAHKIIRDKQGKFVSCQSQWLQDVSVITDMPGAPIASLPSVRNTPAFYYRGDHQGTLLYTAYDNVFSLPFPLWFITQPIAFALDAETGTKLWQIPLVDLLAVAPGGDAVVPSTTSSVRVAGGTAYVGLASLNNALNAGPFGLPLTFRGHMIALNLGGNGLAPDMPSIKWTQFTVPPRPDNYPEGQWFAGGGVWASAPSIDEKNGLVIFGSGQLYNYPDFTAACMETPEVTDFGSFQTTQKGETGKGANECLLDSQAKLKQMGITEPLATNSIIALNMKDGSYKWIVPTAGIDGWQVACGPNLDQTCGVSVVGPDWDVGGSSPIVADILGLGRVILAHNKGGSLLWIEAKTGKVIRKADVCVGSVSGGIHWGLSYDPKSQTIYTACSGGGISPNFGTTQFLSTLANGEGYCAMGYLNAIDALTGKLKWQSAPAKSQLLPVGSQACPNEQYRPDVQFKYGLGFDMTLKNQPADVPVNFMPESNAIPLKDQLKGRANGIPAISNGVVYWPVYYGMVYALDAKSGKFLGEMACSAGSMYVGGPSTARGLVAFGCGYGFLNPADAGRDIMVYGLEKTAVS